MKYRHQSKTPLLSRRVTYTLSMQCPPWLSLGPEHPISCIITNCQLSYACRYAACLKAVKQSTSCRVQSAVNPFETRVSLAADLLISPLHPAFIRDHTTITTSTPSSGNSTCMNR